MNEIDRTISSSDQTLTSKVSHETPAASGAVSLVSRVTLFTPIRKFRKAEYWAVAIYKDAGLTEERVLSLNYQGGKFSKHHTKLLDKLIDLKNYTLEDAMTFIDGLSGVQAWGIHFLDLSRDDAVALNNIWLMRALKDFKKYGMTVEMLISLPKVHYCRKEHYDLLHFMVNETSSTHSFSLDTLILKISRLTAKEVLHALQRRQNVCSHSLISSESQYMEGRLNP